MQIPETPKTAQALDLMQCLKSYAEGKSTWHADGSILGDEARKACEILHTNVAQVVERVLMPLMDRATARELETFTMHDRKHGLKVAHLMWHILPAQRQQKLTPSEIGMLVLAAFLHDVGMALSPEERQKRLAPESSLWDNLEIDSVTKQAFEKLRAIIGDKDALELQKRRAQTQLLQGEEVLLAVDTRERHATPERYREVLERIAEFHQKDKTRIPDVENCMSYYGDSFQEKLIDICVSHNQDSETLIERDKDNPHWLRFSHEFPVGDATADLHMIAAALRIADILDFDRERTPPILFHYLVPGTLAEGNISAIEWAKHLTISNWYIEPSAIVFRGRSRSHITHHAVVQFCLAIQEELSGTHATFSGLGTREWPFAIPTFVKYEIHPEGYNYVPYRFELDDQRVYELLMGGAIYENPLVALRELVQNSIDACKLRDSLVAIYEPTVKPDTRNRITVRYIEPSKDQPVPLVEVEDSGTGMDAWIIERFFLKVGQSYYRSSEFTRTRLQLRGGGCDFAPVSEFGIGFLSCFLLADRVDVETAMWESPRGDTRKRQLQIDGPTRLIQLREYSNDGVARFKGTRIRLWLVRGSKDSKEHPPCWNEVTTYLRSVCQNLPYWINLELIETKQKSQQVIEPLPLRVPTLPAPLENTAVRIPVNTDGLEGELAVVPLGNAYSYAENLRQNSLASGYYQRSTNSDSVLLRGGFSLGEIPTWRSEMAFRTPSCFGRLELKWQMNPDRRYLKPNLARSSSSYDDSIIETLFRVSLEYLLVHANDLPVGLLQGAFDLMWHRKLSPETEAGINRLRFMEEYDAYSVYLLGRNAWMVDYRLKHYSEIEAWERGEAAVPFPSSGVAEQLLAIVLPRITTLRIVPSERSSDTKTLVEPPVVGWQKILQSWRDYISKPARWPVFAPFDEKLATVLYGDQGFLNESFEQQLKVFSEGQLRNLLKLFRRLTSFLSGYTNQALTADEHEFLQKVLDAVGDAEIQASYRRWKLFSLLKSPSS